jgi:nucleoside-diphosphate-sugar epimerase
MIVAITGGTGFIGRKLVLRHLDRGDQVRLLSRRAKTEVDLPGDVIVYQDDLATRSTNLVPFVDGADILYHCAGEIRILDRMYAVHVEGTTRLANAAAGKIGHWVQLSSAGVYGTHCRGVVTEETPENPVGIYEGTKVHADHIVIDGSGQGKFTCTILRPSNVFGPAMRNRSLFQLIETVDASRFFFLGKPGAVANYIFVDNVVDALLRCGITERAKGRIYNLSDHCTIEEMIKNIAQSLDKPTPRFRLPESPVRLFARMLGKVPRFPLTESRVNALTSRVVYACQRIQDELGYRHPVSLDAGFRELVEAWKRTA